MDGFHYQENGRELTLGGEDEKVIPPCLAWDDDRWAPIEDAAAKRVLFNITAAMQWSGLRVYFA